MVIEEGTVLADRYTLLRRLGSGGMGEVWLARDAAGGEPVALKLLAPDLAARPAYRDLLAAEAGRLSGLSHPNIVRVHAFHGDSEPVFLVMRYIAGGDLGALRGASFRVVLPAVSTVCDALEHAHAQGLVHRDVKPGNILVDERGVCYLSDFGVAGIAGVGTGTGGGSLPAASPQQIDGAPPAPADDVYGVGTLLYELLAGQPLFHPDIDAGRIRNEVPASITHDGRGESLPPELVRLIDAMLAKDPARRPAGMAAVRSSLEALCADYPPDSGEAGDAIRPVARRVAEGSASRTSSSPQAVSSGNRRGVPPALLMGGLAVLLMLVAGVVFVLPGLVEKRPPTPAVRPEPPRSVPASADRTDTQALREQADAVLGELLPLQDRLLARAVERWGGADWAEARRLTGDADDRYRERDFVAAATGYRRAVTLLKILEPRVPEVIAAALAAGNAALLEGDREGAEQQYSLVLAVEGDNAAASKGLQRAARLPELLPVMATATAQESAGDLPAAEKGYTAALEIDPDWPAAREGLARTRGAISNLNYETRMAAGYAALARGDFPAARNGFQAALKARADDADARRALAQLAAEERLAQVIELETAAREYAAAEDWTAAAARYEQALEVDANLTSARQGLEQARLRAALAARLQAETANADSLNEDSNWNRARVVADEARRIEPKGAVLAAQIAALETALRIARTTQPVRLVSDNLTEVVILKVGRFGSFAERVVELRPGSYVAVGSRPGFRDTRQTFRVAADGSTPPVIVRCEEAI